MLWAKTQSRATFNLATSGVGSFPLSELPGATGNLEINGDSTYGFAPLQRAIARHCDVGHVGYEMALLVERVGKALNPLPRDSYAY